MSKLSVNIDHVATVRQARGGTQPDPLEAAAICERLGVAGITVHLREDRRHIQDRDLAELRRRLRVPLNLEMAATEEMMGIALAVKPNLVMFVPERRQEITTEGGLGVAGNEDRLARCVERLGRADIPVSLFIDPTDAQVEASARVGARIVELHTGRYANARDAGEAKEQLRVLVRQAAHAQSLKLTVNAGHGLNCANVELVAAIGDLHELHIGHSIVSRAVIVGMEQAVREMLALVARGSARAPLAIE
jgi:pyridoxine 5-phosphate synthase